mmetsp:Transcript_22525/g.62863  ORF Transcript_22525/g.62863 Transcript_22525/m.62863 type:complete len:113 (+) Transcript_22525:530-868(+)
MMLNKRSISTMCQAVLAVISIAVIGLNTMTVEAFQPNPTSVPASTSGASRPDTQTSTTSTSSQLDYATVPASLEVRPKHAKTVRKKPSITSLHSLDELKYFLEDDDRLTVVK